MLSSWSALHCVPGHEVSFRQSAYRPAGNHLIMANGCKGEITFVRRAQSKERQTKETRFYAKHKRAFMFNIL